MSTEIDCKIKIILLLGGPFSGKGYLLEKLLGLYGKSAVCLGLGKRFREVIDSGTADGIAIERYSSRGDLVPEPYYSKIAVPEIRRLLAEVRSGARVVIFDGVVRDEEQAMLVLGEIQTAGFECELHLVLLDVGRSICEDRAFKAKQGSDSSRGLRKDDAGGMEVFGNRWNIWTDKTMPIAEFLKQRGFHVHHLMGGSHTVDNHWVILCEGLNAEVVTMH